jgi:hypothetical protein
MKTPSFVLAAITLTALTFLAAQSGAAPVPAGTAATGSASATATASVRILGPADADVASGAVTLARTGDLEIGGTRAGTHAASASVLDVGGAHNATYAVTFPSEVRVKSGVCELTVSAYGGREAGTARLSPSGTGSVSLGAKVDVTAAEASGRYSGLLPITVAFN